MVSRRLLSTPGSTFNEVPSGLDNVVSQQATFEWSVFKAAPLASYLKRQLSGQLVEMTNDRIEGAKLPLRLSLAITLN